ncbi:MAG: hypothetical protein A2V45_09935 [Candidatus Aminicenantes bacterium RBG_19FT_COMBO_58_17]|nr:MAG: hypothetical protein A2V45_09935 [Candidatus Aminicenantes bacterium RBG_19FT_COMBO_58_17]
MARSFFRSFPANPQQPIDLIPVKVSFEKRNFQGPLHPGHLLEAMKPSRPPDGTGRYPGCGVLGHQE